MLYLCIAGTVSPTTPSSPGISIWGLLAWIISPLVMAIIVLLVCILLMQIVHMKRRLQRNSVSNCPDKNEDEKVAMVVDSRGFPSVLVKCNSLPKIDNNDL